MTEMVIDIAIRIAVLIGGFYLGVRIFKIRNDRMREGREQAAREICKKNPSKDFELKRLSTPPESESNLSGDHDLESYKDLSAGKFERFGDDEIEEAREYLTTKQRKQIGG